VMGDFFQNCDAHVSDDGKKITFRERQETHPMTTPTTPITASVGEPTPIPERPTLYSILTPYHDGSWGLTSPSKVPYRVNEKDKPGSVLVTIPGTRDASYTAELDNYDGLASEEASTTAASDPATVAGEGPYRVEGKYGCITGMSHVFAPFNHHNLRDENDVPGYRTRDIVAWMNHAHRTALAVREGEVVRLRKALEPFAKFAGSKFAGTVWEDRPSSPVLFHSFTGSSVTANDFYAARDALQGAAR
jgi:hypothetical protein